MKLEEIKTREQLPDYLNANGLLGMGVEVGVAYGGFSSHLLTHWKGRRLFCVDPYEDQPKDIYREDTTGRDYGQWYREAALRLVELGGRGVMLRDYSTKAADLFRSALLDFAYIDGNHSELAVMEDLFAWLPKLHSGGVLCGHDYYDSTDGGHHCFVKKSVDQFAGWQKMAVVSDGESWYIKV